MKILYLITLSELGGAQKYILDLTRSLQGRHEIVVAFGEPGWRGEMATALKDTQASLYYLPHLRRAINPWCDLWTFFEIAGLIRRLRPEIIHLNSSKISILGSLAARLVNIVNRFDARHAHPRIRIIYTVHGWVFTEPLPGWLRSFYYWTERLTARLKDRLIAVSEFDRQLAIDRKICPPEKIVTIHNGINKIDFMNRDEAKKVIMEQTGAHDSLFMIHDSKWLVSVGNFYKTKGYEYLIDAVKDVFAKHPDACLFLIGDGPERLDLEARIKTAGLADRIFLLGRLNNAATLLPAFDLFISSSVKEGLSYTIIEAMSAGLPIVATRVGGTPELIEDGRTGLLVPPADPRSLAAAIESLLTDPGLSDRLGRAAADHANAEFTLQTMADDTEQIYHNTIADR